MRIVYPKQMSIGQISIANIELDISSRDDIPKILLGLQYIYITPSLREAVFDILSEIVPCQVGSDENIPASTTKGRPGMNQWTILVLGVLRLGLNADYDRIHELANQHRTIRLMLGHGAFDEDKTYSLSSIRDNLRLFTPEIMDRINQIVVRAGHKLIGHQEDEDLSGRCDSSVTKTDVHYPTDINLLFDSIRKIIKICVFLCTYFCILGWRQSKSNLRKFKRLFKMVMTLKRSKSKNVKKRQANAELILRSYEAYLEMARDIVVRARNTLSALHTYGFWHPKMDLLSMYMNYAEIFIDQIERRVIKGEKIPHAEKIFSIFQPHTEWISKGKAGVPVELGLNVCIVEDKYGFILHHKVMEHEQDVNIAVEMVLQTQARFPNFNQCSFDKGFHSQSNQRELAGILNRVVMPKKGKLTEEDNQREHSEEFQQARRQHAAVESAINALNVHGLDKCLDHGINGFKRYVSIAVVSYNIHKLGSIVLKIEQKKKEEKERKKLKLKAA